LGERGIVVEPFAGESLDFRSRNPAGIQVLLEEQLQGDFAAAGSAGQHVGLLGCRSSQGTVRVG
jgi:hypothetical protein